MRSKFLPVSGEEFEEEVQSSAFIVNFFLCVVCYIFVSYFDCGVGFVLNGFKLNRDNFLVKRKLEALFGVLLTLIVFKSYFAYAE